MRWGRLLREDGHGRDPEPGILLDRSMGVLLDLGKYLDQDPDQRVDARNTDSVRASSRGQPTISSSRKKNAISVAAFSSLSDPWTVLASIDSA